MTQLNNKIYPGKEQTFGGLIKKYGETPTFIIIPKIQRDYAQGRKGKELLRKNFLKDLFEVIDTSNSQPRLYDYIYGQLEKPNADHPESYHFYPVDGQQRLTTIFLLHLYIGKRAGKDIDFLKCFSYQTRNSSKLFCELLCDIDVKEYTNIISYVTDHDRYTSHWQNDPTISSMMTMLSDIDKHFKDKQPLYTQQDFEKCWVNLTENVRFWMLDLSDLDTTDDIYIKMNSRGKGLTAFENFKAELDNLIATKGEGFDEGEFTMKIDTDWTNLFWDYRDKNNDLTETDFENPTTLDYTDNGLDEKMLNFFRNFLTVEGLKNGSLSNSKMGAALSAIDLANLVADSSPSVFSDIRIILDFFWSLHNKGIKISKWFEGFLTKVPEEKRFEESPDSSDVRINPNPLPNKEAPIDYLALFMESQVTSAAKLFAEGIFYLILNKPQTFENISHSNPDLEKMRILRNLIVNSEIHDDDKEYHRDAMKRNLEGVKILMLYGLQALKSHKSEFSGVQIDEEISKCTWIAGCSGVAEQVAMKQIENHSVLRGNLKQLFGLTTLTLGKINNFRHLFKNQADYDEIEQIALSYDNYAIKDGNARNYAEGTLTSWRDRIFVNSNINSLNLFDSMLSGGQKRYQDYTTHRDAFLNDTVAKGIYDWPYYLCKYESMRWAPKGFYLLDGTRYLYYMFNASTCIHSDTYIHYNVYNDALYCLLGSDLISEDDRGGALTVHNICARLDVQERTINIILVDGSRYHIDIPENNGIDSVDRVQLGKEIVNKLIERATHRYEEKYVLRKLVELDLDKQEWPGLIKDQASDFEEVGTLTEIDTNPD